MKNKIPKKSKNNEIKKMLFCFGLGAIIFGIAGVSATTLLYSKDVTYDNTESGMSATTVQEALDELNEKAKSAPSCDSEGNCTVICPSGTEYLSTSTGYKCKKLTAGDKLLAKVDVVTSGDGLYADSYESGRYVYKGSSPNNYITFSGDTWRILAVETDGTLKIMKQDSIGSKTYDDNVSCAWSSATLNTYLNGTYYNSLSTTAKSYIQKHKFNVGNVSSSSSLTTTINEEKATTWTGNIALANVSDYIKSNTNTSSCGSISSLNSNSSTCKTSSFIGTTMISSSSWLLSLYSGDTTYAWFMHSGAGDISYGGRIITGYVRNPGGVLPVLYLKSDTTLSGSGTSSDPYTISV